MSRPVSPERPPADAKDMESSPGTDQGDTPKKGRKKKGDKKPILEMKLTVDVQQWLWKANGKAVKVNITDLKIDRISSGDRSDRLTTAMLPSKWLDTKHCRHLDCCA